MNISICKKCKGFKYDEILNELKKNFKINETRIECNNMCGVGRNRIVVIVDEKPIIANNIEELIKKINAL